MFLTWFLKTACSSVIFRAILELQLLSCVQLQLDDDTGKSQTKQHRTCNDDKYVSTSPLPLQWTNHVLHMMCPFHLNDLESYILLSYSTNSCHFESPFGLRIQFAKTFDHSKFPNKKENRKKNNLLPIFLKKKPVDSTCWFRWFLLIWYSTASGVAHISGVEIHCKSLLAMEVWCSWDENESRPWWHVALWAW